MAEKKKSFVMEIADLQNDRREVTFGYGVHDGIVIAYNPGAFPLKDMERDPGDDPVKISEQLAQVLLDWPIARLGEPLPITRETLLELPIPFVLALYRAITSDLVPGKN